MSSWLVDLRCTKCGAPGKFIDAQLIAICQYCGHIISTHRGAIAGLDGYVLAEARSYVLPTLADVRRLELMDRKQEAIVARDRVTLHATVLELAALDALEGGVEDVATWARWNAAIEDVAMFSGRVAMFAPQYQELANDPAGYTATMIDRYTRVYRELISDDEFPFELRTAIAPETAATDAFLACLKSWFMYVSIAAFETALTTLGQRPIRVHGASLRCRTCGAPICAEALATLACTFCRSPLEVRRHLWLDGILRSVAMANADTLVQRDRAYAAIVMLTHVAAVPGNAVIEDRLIAAYLEALEGIERTAVDEITAFMLAHHSLGPEATAITQTVRRLIDHVPPGEHRSGFVQLPASEAWQRAQLRNWRRVLRYASVPRDQLGLVAVNQLLPPLAGGYLPDPADAATFLRSIDVPVEAVRAGIALHRMGESEPAKAAFWDATAAALT